MVRKGRERLSGEVEVDETLIGGSKMDAGEGGKYGWKKLFILIAAEKDGPRVGRIRMKLIPNNEGKILLGAIQDFIEPGSKVETDGWQGYLKMTEIGYAHKRTPTPYSRGEMREKDTLPRVHKVASLFKRWLLGTFHGRVDPKHLQSYLDEFVFRLIEDHLDHVVYSFTDYWRAVSIPSPQLIAKLPNKSTARDSGCG